MDKMHLEISDCIFVFTYFVKTGILKMTHH